MAPKKLSKKDLEKKKKEEEEKKLQEEEEARLRLIQEEKERIQKEKVEAEERKKLEKQELKLRSVELEEFRGIIGTHEERIIKDNVNRRQSYSWERYLRCDGSPDPSIPQEINTYINLWREDDSNVSIEPIMSEGRLCLRLIEELEFLIMDYMNEEAFQQQIPKYNETILLLQALLQEKIDRTSLEMMSQATVLAESEMSNFEYVWDYEKVTLCLWCNLTKNPRVLKCEFPQIGFTLNIPKALILSDIAFRILHTKYDHFSPRCKHASSRPKIKEKVEEPVEETKEVVPEVEEAKEEIVEETKNILDDLGLIDDENVEKETKVQEVEEEIDFPPEDLVPSPEPDEWEDFDGEEDIVDLRNNTPLGGLFHINLVHLPPQPKKGRGWAMTHQVVPPIMTPYPYSLSGANSATGRRSNSMDITEREPLPGLNKEKQPVEAIPVSVILKFSNDIIVAEEPVVALWSEEEQQWQMKDITVVDYKEQERSITFEMNSFGVVGLFQNFHINMPFQMWTLRPYRTPPPVVVSPQPKGKHDDATVPVEEVVEDVEEKQELDYNPESKNQSLLVVTAAIFEVKLHICDDRVRILSDDEHPEINVLAGKWYSVPDLVKMMRNCGVNIFPREDSPKYVATTVKNAIAEDRLYDQMALLSPSVAFSWSRWNSDCKNAETIIVLASEHLNYERTVNEDDWSVLSFTRKKVEKLKMKEYDEAFSTEKDDRLSFHSNLYHMYQEFGSDEGMIAVKNIDYKYYDTLRSLLKAIRPVMFS